MYYVIAEGAPASQGKPYHLLKFKSLRDMKECPLIDKGTIVYSEVTQLDEFCTKVELDAIWHTLNLSSKAPQSRRVTAGLLHEYVVENAVVWKQGEKPMTEVMAEAPKEKKVANRSRVSKEAKIVVLKKFEGRAESIRGKALSIAMAAPTVEKAVADMRAAGFTAAVANATIKFAVAEQLIALKA
jgi:hypothetical protein